MMVETGTHLGRYVVHEHLGEGALGPVYRAYEPAAGSVAAKVLQQLAAPAAIERFRLVAPQLLTLRHPNLASVLEYGEHEGVPYLIVQYVQGGSLADRLRTATISLEGLVWILRGVAEGVDHAHRSGFVHGNLKPEQILLGTDDHPFVTDCALAPLRLSYPAGTAPAALAGSAAYVAPEEVSGGGATAAADRYAFAVVAYQLLTGRVPFEGDPREVMTAQVRLEPPAPSRRNSTLGPATDAVLLRGLAKEPSARWQSCVQMVDALTEALDRDTRVMPAPFKAPVREGRRAWPWLLAAVVLLAIGIAAGVAFWMANQPQAVGINLSSSTVRAGDSLVVSANHLPANQVGTIQLQSAPVQIGVFSADQYGNFQRQVTIPATTDPGDHTIDLCWNGGCHGSQRLTVTELPPSPSPSASPSPSPSASPSPSPSPTPAPTPTPTPTSTPSPSPSPFPTPKRP